MGMFQTVGGVRYNTYEVVLPDSTPQFRRQQEGYKPPTQTFVVGHRTLVGDGGLQVVVLSLVPEACPQSKHDSRLNRLSEHVQSWDDAEMYLLTAADSVKYGHELARLLSRIQKGDDTPKRKLGKPENESLVTYVNSRHVVRQNRNGKLEYLATVGETKRLIGYHREVILQRGEGQVVAAVDGNGQFYASDNAGHWATRLPTPVKGVLSQVEIPYNGSMLFRLARRLPLPVRDLVSKAILDGSNPSARAANYIIPAKAIGSTDPGMKVSLVSES